ncbi:MAG: isoleucine--tRNA ligase [bacterium]
MPNKKQEVKQTNNPFPAMEEEVLNFWEKNKIFEKSLKKEAPQGDYVFYDGPPFGTGEPHYGHLLSSISKDVMPRFWTMQGYRVERRWGWDCHGLPIENIIEKDLKISGKKEIEKIGIDKFCETCRSRVLEYADIWEVMIRRIGRWVEFKNSYKTMDVEYMESVWWGFKTLWNKNLIYQGRKVQLYCPRCETPISNFEVAMDNSYKDITETSIYVKFKLKDSSKLGVKEDIFIIAWTTTPWTLPGNVALAVGEKIEYVLVKITSVYYILAKERLEIVKENYEIVKELKGKDLVGLEYEPLFDVPALKESGKNVYKVLAADFVTTEDGTGVVHTAVVYGEDDYNLGLKYDLPVIPALDEKGHFNETVPQFKGVYFKKADKMVIEDLDKRGLVFVTEQTSHSYPFCHRCDTQLFYNAIPAWFMAVSKLKKRMLELNKKINWFPEYLKNGRFALGIEQAPDWNISRNRYFGTPIPVWRCDKCGELEVIGSVKELEDKTRLRQGSGRQGGQKITDIHIHKINDLSWPCTKCDGSMKRISEVLDCWVESGSMPFAQMHYPFENKEKFEANFPAQFISEYISQTRAWFYVMHVMAAALFDSNSFENVIATGVILNEKGDKMSKSKKNYPDPWKVINEYGVDALRFYLMSSPVMAAENLFFNERDLRDIFRKNIMILWNVYKFYEMYQADNDAEKYLLPKSEKVLDKWILAKLNILSKDVTENMKSYNLPKATRPISEFINDFSTWYLRRSRDRFKSDDKADQEVAIKTTRFILLELAKIIAPVMPFMAETIWQKVTGLNFKDENKSVHLTGWVEYDDPMEEEDVNILKQMEEARKIVELGLKARDEAGIKVRQMLNEVQITNYELEAEYNNLIADELNVKKVVSKKGKGKLKVELDTVLTDDLKSEGLKREIVRLVNNLRKNAGLTIQDRIILSWQSDSEMIKNVFTKMAEELKKDTLTEKIIEREIVGEEVKVNGEMVKLEIKKI